MTLAARPTRLAIDDIAGYPRFMKLHTMSLVHAHDTHDIVSRLLEAVIDAAGPALKLEGDAAFFYLPLAEDRAPAPPWIASRVAAIHVAFHRRAADLGANTPPLRRLRAGGAPA